MPALWALSGCSIFIASSTTMTSPSATVCAVLDGDLDDGALHRGGDRVAGRGGAGLLAAARLGFFAPPAAAPPAGDAAAEAGGQDDLEPLAADLDGHRLPLARRSSVGLGESPAYGAIWLSNSVSIQGVWTANGAVAR